MANSGGGGTTAGSSAAGTTAAAGASGTADTAGTAGTAGSSASGSGYPPPGTWGKVPYDRVSPREGSPSEGWATANSDIRSSSNNSGIGAGDLLLWILTAVAAVATLILVARLRGGRNEGQ